INCSSSLIILSCSIVFSKLLYVFICAGNRVFNPDEDTQSKILELLLQKSVVPIEKNSLVDVELANKFADLKELLTLKEELELERAIAKMAEGKSLTNKRGERKLIRHY
uniref:Urotensin 2 domain containing n=1 Tax=Oryzias melastigma TaxID=30732 RepID=A0A3B3C0N7_ORYME